MPDAVFRLTRPLDRHIRDGHPWVYRDAVRGDAPAGAVVTLVDARDQFVARGIADEGPIAMRVFTTRDEQLGPAMFRARIASALALREAFLSADTTAWRLLHGEGDRLPGFVCDVYEQWAVLKPDGAGARAWLDTWLEALEPTLAARGITNVLLRHARRANTDGNEPRVRVLRGALPNGLLDVKELGMTLPVDLEHGQKTGLFLDQRVSRARVRSWSAGRTVLNLYSYTGGFSIAAGLGGAKRVESVDVASGAIELCTRGWERNGLAPSAHMGHVADVPAFLSEAARKGKRYDLVIADPPSFAPNEASVPAALKSYRALHTAAIGCVAPGGLYLAASCSSHVGRDAFMETVVEGARKSGRALQWLDGWGGAVDHPRLPAFPEGDYLKALLFRVAT